MPLVNPAAARAILEYQGTVAQAVQSIMKHVVAEKSEEKHTNKNIILLLWLYDDKLLCKDLICNRLIEKLHAMASTDANMKQRPNSRCIYRTWLQGMVRGEDNTCPIILEKMTFNLFCITSICKGNGDIVQEKHGTLPYWHEMYCCKSQGRKWRQP
eukprot:15329824-Ditylum_brightwellii.AAC.1